MYAASARWCDPICSTIPKSSEAMDRCERANRQALSNSIAMRGNALPRSVGGRRRWASTLVEFYDYACGFCRTSNPDIERLLREDPRLKVLARISVPGRRANRRRSPAWPPPRRPLRPSRSDIRRRQADRSDHRRSESIRRLGTVQLTDEFRANDSQFETVGRSAPPERRPRRWQQCLSGAVGYEALKAVEARTGGRLIAPRPRNIMALENGFYLIQKATMERTMNITTSALDRMATGDQGPP